MKESINKMRALMKKSPANNILFQLFIETCVEDCLNNITQSLAYLILSNCKLTLRLSSL